MLTATGLVSWKEQFSTLYRIDTPLTDHQKFVTGDYVGDPFSCAKFGAHPSTGVSGRMGKIQPKSLWPPCVTDADIIFLSCFFLSFFLLFFLAYSRPSQIGCVPYFHTWCGLSANLECMSLKCAARGSLKIHDTKKSPSGHHRTTLSGYIFATKACIDTRKKLLNSNISSTCRNNMANFGH